MINPNDAVALLRAQGVYMPSADTDEGMNLGPSSNTRRWEMAETRWDPLWELHETEESQSDLLVASIAVSGRCVLIQLSASISPADAISEIAELLGDVGGKSIRWTNEVNVAKVKMMKPIWATREYFVKSFLAAASFRMQTRVKITTNTASGMR